MHCDRFKQLPGKGSFDVQESLPWQARVAQNHLD